MAYELHIPSCILSPPHSFHPPPPEHSLRIQIQGPLVAIQKLMPEIEWRFESGSYDADPQEGGRQLARLTHEALYGELPDKNQVVIRDEYPGWVEGPMRALNEHSEWVEVPRPLSIDYYGVTFDHNVPREDRNPEVLAISIIELEADSGEFANGIEFANTYLYTKFDPDDYIGKRILAVPRCCQLKKGTQDRSRINMLVDERDDAGKWSELR